MEACNTWQCFNSFAPWLSAFGAILISGLALWLSVLDKFIRLKANYSGCIIPSYDPMRLDTYAYVLDLVNVGTREVQVTNFEWHWKHAPFLRRQRTVIQPYLDERVTRLCSKLPMRLSDGDTARINFASDFIEKLDSPERFLFPANTMKAFFRIFTSEIYLCTSVGRKIKVQMKAGMRREIWSRYKKYNKSMQPTAKRGG
ncbi:hypothetical protein BET10_05100 [Pseudoalteromonas amylolytica]|uniref:Uncharacterized protein n=1 Tax=Pseudoalteromonas amylolytica TaxID=1859457 RepID=A0A1S1N049_9GAMM|nr:hypothetical protein BFC16_02795 [Pseudoalteromonas sp. JW3]OHU92827.1 hypothetical protein BET10_05100 [Pseudoalteromonas amylolytica]